MNLVPVSLKTTLVAPMRPALLLLIFAVGLLLLIACANAANLLLSRAASRRKEIAIRLAIGPTRSRLMRQLLTESVLLASLGGAVGFALASSSLNLIVVANAKNIPQLSAVSLDWRVLAFTFAVSLLTGMVFGLVPALASARATLNSSLKDSATTAAGGVRHASSESLIVFQFALAVMLLIGAALLGIASSVFSV